MSSTTAAPTTAATSAPTAAPTTAATAAVTTAPIIAATPVETTTAPVNTEYGVFVLIVLVIFIIVAIYCVVKSLMCFGKSGSIAEKIIGVLIAFFMGPFYLLYLNFNDGYCNAEEPMISSPQMVGGRRRK